MEKIKCPECNHEFSVDEFFKHENDERHAAWELKLSIISCMGVRIPKRNPRRNKGKLSFRRWRAYVLKGDSGTC